METLHCELTYGGMHIDSSRLGATERVSLRAFSLPLCTGRTGNVDSQKYRTRVALV